MACSPAVETLRRTTTAGVALVFGSVARGEDGPESDIDLLVTLPSGASLFDIGALEAGLTALLVERVDLVPDDGLRPHSREEILAEAVPL